MNQEPLFTVKDRRAVCAAGMAPAQWIREQRRELEWLGFLRRSSDWVMSFSAMLPHLRADQSLWGDALPALLGEWTQQAELLREPQRKSSLKPASASLAETKSLQDFYTAGGDERGVKGTRFRPPSSRTGGQTQANPRQRQRPSASSFLTPRSAPLAAQAPLPAAEKPLNSSKPELQRLQSRIAESVLRKIAGEHLNTSLTGERLNPSPSSSTRLDNIHNNPVAQFSGIHREIRPHLADHSKLRQNWQNGIAKRVLLTMKVFGDPGRNKRLIAEMLTGQWRLTLDGPQALREQLVRSSVSEETRADNKSPHNTDTAAPYTANINRLISSYSDSGMDHQNPNAMDANLGTHASVTNKHMPVSGQAADKYSQGRYPETSEPSPPASTTARITDTGEVKRKHGPPDTPKMAQRHQQQSLPAASNSDLSRTQPMPAEPVLDSLIREAASGIPDMTTESLAPGHGLLPANLPASSEQATSPAPWYKAPAAAYQSVSDTVATGIRPSSRFGYAAAQSNLDDLADQIKRILDEEARRYGIDI